MTKYITEANDGSIIPPASNMTAMTYGITLSHVVESGDILICCGVSGRSGEESINPRQHTTHVMDTAITATSGTMILHISSAETPSNLQDQYQCDVIALYKFSLSWSLISYLPACSLRGSR